MRVLYSNGEDMPSTKGKAYRDRIYHLDGIYQILSDDSSSSASA
jgi:hypothetical protein